MAKNKENKKLSVDSLLAKYGEDEIVGVVKKSDPLMKCLPNDGVVSRAKCYITKGNTRYTLMGHLQNSLEYMPRYLAEVDEDYMQPIGYAIVKHWVSGKYYCTKRLNGGDERLVGARSIGIGGHIDEGENIHESLYRELKEEVGINQDDIFTNSHVGFIYSDKTAVNRVHLGLVFACSIKRESISVREKDKLAGEWVTLEQLKEYYDNGELESWSEYIFEFIMEQGGRLG